MIITVCLSVVFTVIVIHIGFKKTPMPSWVETFFIKCLGRCVCITGKNKTKNLSLRRRRRKREEEEEEEEDEEEKKEGEEEEEEEEEDEEEEEEEKEEEEEEGGGGRRR